MENMACHLYSLPDGTVQSVPVEEIDRVAQEIVHLRSMLRTFYEARADGLDVAVTDACTVNQAAAAIAANINRLRSWGLDDPEMGPQLIQ